MVTSACMSWPLMAKSNKYTSIYEILCGKYFSNWWNIFHFVAMMIRFLTNELYSYLQIFCMYLHNGELSAIGHIIICPESSLKNVFFFLEERLLNVRFSIFEMLNNSGKAEKKVTIKNFLANYKKFLLRWNFTDILFIKRK